MPRTPPAASDLPAIGTLGARAFAVAALARTHGRYDHWDTLRHLPPPEDTSHLEWWAVLKWTRELDLLPSEFVTSFALCDAQGGRFRWATLPTLQRLCMRVDQQLRVNNLRALDQARMATYAAQAMQDEAIASSLVEGAATTYAAARALLASQRTPRSAAEHMVLSNHRAMQWVQHHHTAPLTEADLLALHATILEDATPDGHAPIAGRYRRDDENIGVRDGDELVHRPPPAPTLATRMAAMLRFANEDWTTGEFVHPVVRAMLLHFWVAYDHPFCDGNGRVARALFYWSLLHHGYDLARFISISEIIYRGRTAYDHAFIHAETDGNDATYFLLHQAEVITRALDKLDATLAQAANALLHAGAGLDRLGLNHRQRHAVAQTLQTPTLRYTFRSYQLAMGISYQSARTDLLDLQARKLLASHREGKTQVFVPVTDLAQRVAVDAL